jgi:geranylgeranyl reductase family protein
MSNSYDAIVIGAGPAGLNAALHLLKARPRPRVLLVDKQVPWEKPIACAEGVWCEPFSDAVRVKKEWIRLYISSVVLHSANDSKVSYYDKDKGCIINRSLMQSDMASQCIERGATAWFDCKAVDVGPDNGSAREVLFENGLKTSGSIVIDASGPLSSFGKKEKILSKAPDLEPAYFAIAENTGIEKDSIHVYLGTSIAPGGYAWAFPREDGTANVGLVVGKTSRGKADIKKLLDLFIRGRFPGSSIVRRFAGPIPCGAGAAPLAVPRLFKAGDAASTVNPLSRAGIAEALCSGGLAGEFGMAMLHAASESRIRDICREYQEAWHDKIGRRHGKLSRVKKTLARVPDRDYNKAFGALGDVGQEKLTISRIIRLSLGRFPSLVFAMRHLM